MNEKALAVLRANVEGMKKSLQWLWRSQEKCILIGIRQSYAEDEFDTFENLVGRYARCIDIILNKVFRSIDAVELEDGGSLIDVINRAEKRGIVASADRIRELKELRNEIVHEYETDDLRGLFRSALESTPEIFALAERVERYCQRFQP